MEVSCFVTYIIIIIAGKVFWTSTMQEQKIKCVLLFFRHGDQLRHRVLQFCCTLQQCNSLCDAQHACDGAR